MTSKPRIRPAVMLGAALASLALLAGIYVFPGGGRKAEAPAAGSAATASTSAGISRELATGALAAFVIGESRREVADLSFKDAGGRDLRLSQWRGRIVLVNLWATWCAPCRKEMPDLAKLQKALGSDDFEVVAISVDRKGVAASAAFLGETGAEALSLYIDESARVLNDLQALGLPATVLVDRKGYEIGRLLGPADWSSPEALALIRAAINEK